MDDSDINDSYLDPDPDAVKSWELMNGRLEIEVYSGEIIVISNSTEIQEWLELLRSGDD
jgi:hypothetical protein